MKQMLVDFLNAAALALGGCATLVTAIIAVLFANGTI